MVQLDRPVGNQGTGNRCPQTRDYQFDLDRKYRHYLLWTVVVDIRRAVLQLVFEIAEHVLLLEMYWFRLLVPTNVESL